MNSTIEPIVPRCGSGGMGAPATCEGECSSSCDDGDPCTVDKLVGSAIDCDASCTHQLIIAAKGGDGCCPPSATARTDSDCSPTCGDGVKNGNEICDGADCPTDCDDGNPCTNDRLVGSAAQCNATCVHQPITAAHNSDGCCPPMANAKSDSDCTATCGNGIAEPDETCDGADCPTSCDDGDPCTSDKLNGSSALCNTSCSHEPITTAKGGDGCCPPSATARTDSDCSPTCGDGVKNGNEICDGADCPTDCDDGDPCTADRLVGSAAQCNASCVHQPITTPHAGDGCCPPSANAKTDSDCTAVCGNHVIEPGESCDGNCPASCDDGDPCTADSMIGLSGTCDLVCSHPPITTAKNGDGCCPPSANAKTDSDCAPECGDGVKNGSETCDGADCPTSCDDGDSCTADKLIGSAPTCNAQCVHTPLLASAKASDGCCPAGATNANDVDCQAPATCGNGVLDSGEQCDDSVPHHPCPTTDDECNRDKLSTCWNWKLSGAGCQRTCVHSTGICGTVPDSDLGMRTCNNDCPAGTPDPWH